MKLSMRLTLDGLVHAMRLKAHETAEAVENGRADGSVRDQRSGGHLGAKGTGTGFISFPGSLSVGEANRLIKAFMRRIWDGRESVSFAVPQSERRLEAGSILRLPEEENGPDFLVDEVEDGLVRRVHARRIVRSADAPVWEPDAPGGTEPSRSFVPATPHVLFLDLPMRTSQERPQDQLRIAARAIPWRRQAVLASPEETGFALRTSLSARAVIGVLQEELGPGKVEGRVDRASEVLVRLFDGELQSVTRSQMLSGANAAAIRSRLGSWEVFQFEMAEEIAPSIWRLARLLRGQLGTNDAMMRGADAGADFVLLNEAVAPAGLNATEIGLQLNWRVGPAGVDISTENFAVVSSLAGGIRALLPLSPVHLNAQTDGGDLHLAWIRRGRLDADSWLAEDIPLGEEREKYRIDFAPVGGEAVRSATVVAPAFIYSAAMREHDFPQAPAAIDVIIRQLSAVVGPGTALRQTVRLT